MIISLAQRRWHDSTHAANTSGGQRSMQAVKEPPGQSLGDGVGEGTGVGDGVGAAVVVQGGKQSVHQVPPQSAHWLDVALQEAEVSPQYFPSHVQHADDGEGDGVGDGLGDGLGPTVLPMGPYLMSENLTVASAKAFSTSFGSPLVTSQGPRQTPGWSQVPSTGYVESNQSMLHPFLSHTPLNR